MEMTVSAVVQARKHPPYRTIAGALTLVPVPGPCSTASYEMFQVEHGVFRGHVPRPHTKCSKWNMTISGAQAVEQTALTWGVHPSSFATTDCASSLGGGVLWLRAEDRLALSGSIPDYNPDSLTMSTTYAGGWVRKRPQVGLERRSCRSAF